MPSRDNPSPADFDDPGQVIPGPESANSFTQAIGQRFDMTLASLLPIDVGFDVRIQHMLVRLNEFPLRYMVGTGERSEERITSSDPESVAEELARAGYSVVAFETSTGRDVQCTLQADAPVGATADVDPDATPGFTWTGNVWAVQARNDNYWCVVPP